MGKKRTFFVSTILGLSLPFGRTMLHQTLDSVYIGSNFNSSCLGLRDLDQVILMCILRNRLIQEKVSIFKKILTLEKTNLDIIAVSKNTGLPWRICKFEVNLSMQWILKSKEILPEKILNCLRTILEILQQKSKKALIRKILT